MSAGEPDPTAPEQPGSAGPADAGDSAAGPLADLVETAGATPDELEALSEPVREALDELAAGMPPADVTSVPTPGPKAKAKAGKAGSVDKPAERRGFSPVRFLGAFVVATAFALLLAAGAAYGLTQAYTNRVVPGVKVGSSDLSGLDRDQAIAKLTADYGYLGQGKVTVATPVGTTTITYAELGRAPDTEAMADAALAIGHGDNFLGNAAITVRTALSGQSIAVVVRMDPTAIATKLRSLVGTTTVAPRNATVAIVAGKYAISPATKGRGIDETSVAASIIDKLVHPDAPAELKADGAFVDLAPQFDDADAAGAVAAAQKMAVTLSLTWGGPWPDVLATPTPTTTATPSAPFGDSPSPAAGDSGMPTLTPTSIATATPTVFVSPTPSPSPIPARTFTIDSTTIESWIYFGWKTDGTYGPMADSSKVRAYLQTLSPKVRIAPREPRVNTDSTGKPVSLSAGANGADINLDATALAVGQYLQKLAVGTASGPGVAIVMRAVEPQINSVAKLDGMVIIGSWTTTFYPGESNGFGVNIRLPAALLNGQVVAPGQRFSFFDSVGPLDLAHGWVMGGVIVGGKSNHTGAIGGGICSASTTMFNAAARAGLQIDERHAHFYYIDRYPAGLDATVYMNGVTTWDLKWTNDTPYPIVIRGYSTKGSISRVTFELWSLPLGRSVTFNGVPAAKFKGGTQTDVVKAGDGVVYVSTLAPGQKYRAEYPTAGFNTTVTRVVTDQSGSVIHTNQWNSHYVKVDGILQVGAARTAPASAAVVPANNVLGRRRRAGGLISEELAG
jgi:vancomycin resistance protein YoaR